MTVLLYARASLPKLRLTAAARTVSNTLIPEHRTMATVRGHLPHTVRTANDPRQTGFFDATISRVDEINRKIRLLRLSLPVDQVRTAAHNDSMLAKTPQ